MKEKREELSERETAVMELLCEGLSQKQVADRLGISFGTAGTYVMRIYRKLGIHTRAEAVVAWIRKE